MSGWVWLVFGLNCCGIVVSIYSKRRWDAGRKRYERLSAAMEQGIEDVKVLQAIWHDLVDDARDDGSITS